MSICYESAKALEDLDNYSLCICEIKNGENIIRKLKNPMTLPFKYKADFILGQRIVMVDNAFVDYIPLDKDTFLIKEGEYCRIVEVDIHPKTIY